MSKQTREPDKRLLSPTEGQSPASHGTAYPPRRGLSRRGWLLTGLGGVLVVLLVVGLIVSQQLGAKSSPAAQSSRPVPQVVPPAHQTYDAHAPATLQGSTAHGLRNEIVAEVTVERKSASRPEVDMALK